MPDERPWYHYVIYHNPRDCPGKFVVRRFLIEGPTPIPDRLSHAVCDTLAEARATIPHGQFCMPRDPSDEPQIVESWI